MLSYVAKSSNMSPFMKATVTAVAGAKQVLNPSAIVGATHLVGVHPAPEPTNPLSGDTLRKQGIPVKL
jgi:hypothetical protein